MLLRLAALGALGYVAYKGYERNRVDKRIPLAGGPLSENARLVHSVLEPPPPEAFAQ